MPVSWIETTRDGTSVLITARGELDLTSCPALRGALAEAAQPGLKVVVDLSAVTFLDSSVLAVLAATARHLRGTERRLAIQQPSARVLIVLRISGMLSLFDVTPPPSMRVPMQSTNTREPPLVLDLSNGAIRGGMPMT